MNVGHPANFQSIYEEADTFLTFHASSAIRKVMIRAFDTDVLVILLEMSGRYMTSDQSTSYTRIIMDYVSGNSRRHTGASNTASTLESNLERRASVLPELHEFTGSDFTSASYGKGKMKPLEVLKKDTERYFIKFFIRLASKTKAEEFICSLYCMKGLKKVDEAWHVKLSNDWEDLSSNITIFPLIGVISNF